MKIENIILMQEQYNKKLAQLFSSYGIKKFNFTALGNSIALGYSLANTTKPLLLRNESLSGIMEENDIDLNIYHFARSQNNNDEHVFDWLIQDIKLSEIYEFNINDAKRIDTPIKNFNEEFINMYYKVDLNMDQSIRDIIFEENPFLANIIVYCGGTGSLLDNITRNKSIVNHGIKRDRVSIEALLKYIQVSNRIKGTNTQLYICGNPRSFSFLINHGLEKITFNYANTTYVPAVFGQILYRQENKIFPMPDYHYNEEEYMKFNNNIIFQIYNNFLLKEAMIEIDRVLFQLSKGIELKEFSCDKTVGIQMDNIFEKWCVIFKERGLSPSLYFKMIEIYLKSRWQYDYYYIGRESVITRVKKFGK